MDQKNLEVERAVIDLVEQVQAYPLESSVSDVIDEEIDVLMDHYQRLMYAIYNPKGYHAALQLRAVLAGGA